MVGSVPTPGTIKSSDIPLNWDAVMGKVSRGESVVIENSGIPVAVITPLPDSGRHDEAADRREAFAIWRDLRQKMGLTPEEVRAFREEGQK